MLALLQSVIAFIVTLGVLITFHEFGHYWVARRCNVKILRFSIGFGRAIYKRHFGPDNTEFVIAAFPLGGYVKMLDERETEVPEKEYYRAFNRKPLWQRFLIVLAGPIFNFIFAILAYWIIFVIGVTGLKPFIGEVEPTSLAALSGLSNGEEIITVDGVSTPTWSAVLDRLINHTVNANEVVLKVRDGQGVKKETSLDLAKISIDDIVEGNLLDAMGISVIKLTLPAIIGEVLPHGAAKKGGLLNQDEIIMVNGMPINNWAEWVEIIQNSPDKKLVLKVLRGGETIQLEIVPEAVVLKENVIGRIGVAAAEPEGWFEHYFSLEHYSFFHAFNKAIGKTWEMSLLTLQVLGKMLVGEASVKNLSGPISIAQYAGQSAGIGWIAFFSFMAIVSISLGVLNLLPIPMLDGGHLMYYLAEMFIRRPVSESVQIIGQQLGLVLLLILMSIAFYNDITRLMIN